MTDQQWIKPSEMPKEFWGHAWVLWKSCWGIDPKVSAHGVTMVQNVYARFSTHGAYFNGVWEDWRPMNDEEFRILLITEPEWNEDVFNG